MIGLASRRGGGFAFGLALVLLLAGVAAASRTRLFHEGEPPISPAAARLAVDFATYLFFALLATSCVFIAWALWPRDYEGPEAPRRSLRTLVAQMLVSLAATALAVVVITQLRLQRLAGQQLGGARGAGNLNPADQLTRSVPNTPAAFDWTAAGLVAATLLIAGVIAWKRLSRARRMAERRRALARELEEVVQDTLDDLRLDADPRRAVIQAYARMERVLALHGVARRPPEAPLEFLARALASLAVPPAASARLTDLFEEARFSTHAVSERMRDEAVACLLGVRAALAS